MGLPEIFGGTSIPIASHVKPLWLPGNQKVDNSRNNSAPAAPQIIPGASSIDTPHLYILIILNNYTSTSPLNLIFKHFQALFKIPDSAAERWRRDRLTKIGISGITTSPGGEESVGCLLLLARLTLNLLRIELVDQSI